MGDHQAPISQQVTSREQPKSTPARFPPIRKGHSSRPRKCFGLGANSGTVRRVLPGGSVLLAGKDGLAGRFAGSRHRKEVESSGAFGHFAVRRRIGCAPLRQRVGEIGIRCVPFSWRPSEFRPRADRVGEPTSGLPAMPDTRTIRTERRMWAPFRWTPLVVSLVCGAYLTVFSTSSDKLALLALLTPLPVFFAIRLCRPVGALLCGAIWGLSLYLFSLFGGESAIPVGVRPALLLTVVPAVYACLGSRLTRWIGFSPFVLGVCWAAVELALQPLGLRGGLLLGVPGEGAFLGWVGGTFGYIAVASVVAVIAAALVSVLSTVTWGGRRKSLVAGSGDEPSTLQPQTFSCHPFLAIRTLRPRAPPWAACR